MTEHTQRPTLTDLDASDPDVLKLLTTARSKGDLADYVSASYSLSREPHKCARCGMLVPNTKGLIPCRRRDCPE